MPLPLQSHNPQKMVDSPGQIRRLEKKNVKPTAIRLLVVDAIASAHRAVSLSDLEVILDTVDKSSIFRTLELFVKHHVVHAIDDGSGSVKYEICEGEEEERCLQGLRNKAALHLNTALPHRKCNPVAKPSGYLCSRRNRP